MKKIYLLFTLLSASVLSVFAQNYPSEYIQNVLHPWNSWGEDVLAPPPSDTYRQDEWQFDQDQYFALKEPSIKNNQENWDSVWAQLNEQYYFVLYRLGADSVMNASFLSDVSWSKNIYNGRYSVNYERNAAFPSMNNLQSLCEQMKNYNVQTAWRTRPRPYKYFDNQWYAGTQYHQNLNDASSYPSGHGYFRGLFGKCMEIVDPDSIVKIDKMLDEWLNCRLLLGAHWKSDLPAGKTLGEIAFDSAMTVDEFRNQVLAARRELKAYRNNSNDIPETSDIETNIETYLGTIPSTPTDFVLHRTFYKDDAFNTLCLPFDLASLDGTPLEGAEVYAFESATKNGDDELELFINPVTSITAGTPYLIKWASGDNIYSMTFNNVTITASTGATVGTGVQFVGSMGQSELPQANNYLFVGANNTLYWPNTANKLKGFRAYFVVNGSVAPHSTPARLVIRNTPTGVPYTGTNEPACKRIDNGQLYIIRNGVKYNAQGQTIK